MKTLADELLHHWDCCEESRCLTCGDLIRETADENEQLRALLLEACELYERGRSLGGGTSVHDLTLVPLTSAWYKAAKGEPT